MTVYETVKFRFKVLARLSATQRPVVCLYVRSYRAYRQRKVSLFF